MSTHNTSSTASQATPRKRRRVLRRWLIALVCIIALLVVAIVATAVTVAGSFNEVQRVSITQDPALVRPPAHAPGPSSPAPASAPTNILLLGSDSRAATDPDQDGASMTGSRSDAIMVAQISPDGSQVTVMSIMRDNWVEIQGYGDAKINAAMSFGGPPLAVNTVENFIGARIDHVAMVDFESFQGLTDALGGVTVLNDQSFTSTHGNVTFEPGEITLTGKEALSYVRERYAFPDGDYQRARNQQAYLKGLIRGVLHADTLTNPRKLASTFDALKPYLILDEDFDTASLVRLAWQVRDVRSEDITFFTSPTLGTGTSPDGQSIVLPNWEELALVQNAFATGTLNAYAENLAPGAELPQ